MERVQPLVITVDDKVYTLDFSRASVSHAERMGFDIRTLGDKPLLSISELFYHAFYMHHPDVKKEETDRILFEELEGLTDGEVERLSQLLEQTYSTLIRKGERKNSRVTVEL